MSLLYRLFPKNRPVYPKKSPGSVRMDKTRGCVFYASSAFLC